LPTSISHNLLTDHELELYLAILFAAPQRVYEPNHHPRWTRSADECRKRTGWLLMPPFLVSPWLFVKSVNAARS